VENFEIYKGIGVVVAFIIITIISFFGGRKSINNNEQDKNTVTYKYIQERETQYYDDFVKKETYKEYRKTVENEFTAMRGELKEEFRSLNERQAKQGEQITTIDKAVAVLLERFTNFSESLKNLPKRKED
jgi:beta-N-acetylglucosaminidase